MRLIAASILGLMSPLFALACDGPIDSEVETPTVETAAVTTPSTIVPNKELFITALGVVDNAKFADYKPGKWNTEPDGAWSFGRLIDNMAATDKQSDLQRSAFVMNWLLTWESPQTINGQVLPPRPLVRDFIITPWKLRSVGKLGNTTSTCDATPETDFTCKLSFARNELPFELMAIVNRPDLRVVPADNDWTHGAAGQGRFIFVLIDADRNPLPFTVIFEYMVPATGLAAIKDYQDKWHALGKKNFDSKFCDDLKHITDVFTKRNAAPTRNSGSALLQLRTNDVMLAEQGSDPSHPLGVMWELREFVVGTSGFLTPDTTKLEPPLELSGSATLGEWADANAAAILDNTYEMPATLNGAPFVAASSIAPFSFVWDIPSQDDQVRDALALGTCNGCHVNETGTQFLHTFQFTPGAEATLSPWLEGQLAQGGPRVTDLKFILDSGWDKIKTGKGKDKGHKP